MQAANTPPDGKRTVILLIAEDKDAHPYLKQNLRRAGFSVLLAVDTEDAFEWIGGSYVHADMVLVNLISKTTNDALIVGREVRHHAKYNDHTPLVVMADKYEQALEGTEDNVDGNDWVFYLGEEQDQLQNFLRRLVPDQKAA